MSALESIIWHILGYLAMPTIFIGGFVAVFLVAIVILKFLGETPVEE